VTPAMRSNVYSTRNEAREKRNRQRLEAGLISDRFPSVARIVVTVNYRREKYSSVLRTLNFSPESPAFFRISCLGEGCEDGGLDLTRVIRGMIRRRERTASGELRCDNRDPEVVHAGADYKVAITYA